MSRWCTSNWRRTTAIAVTALMSVVMGAPLGARGQTKPVSPAAVAPVVRSWATLHARIDADARSRVWGRPVLRIGGNYDLPAEDTVRQTVVVFGSAKIDGFVDGDLTVVLGDAQLAPTAIVNGAVTVIGGSVHAAEGALVRDELVLVGGEVTSPSDVFMGGGHVVIGAPAFGERLREVLPWLTRGLLWGRLIVPELGWIWWFIAVAFLISLLVNTAFHDPVTAAAAMVANRPLGSFLSGLLVLLLLAPVTLLLVASIIGALVLPFLLSAVVLAAIIGKTGVSRALGSSLVRVDDPDSRALALRSFLIGSTVIDVLYMIPILGLPTWALSGVLGLGAAVLAFFGALRRENPEVRREPDVPPVPRAPMSAPPMPEPAMATPAPEIPVMPRLAGVPAGGAATLEADLRAFPHATFGDRLAAFALDLLVVFIVTQWLGHDNGNRFFVYLLTYFTVFWAWKGTTVGGIICNLRVVRVDGQPLSPGDAIIRGLSGVLSIAAAGLGGLQILRDPDQQAWHDRIAGTFVVKVPRGWPVG